MRIITASFVLFTSILLVAPKQSKDYEKIPFLSSEEEFCGLSKNQRLLSIKFLLGSEKCLEKYFNPQEKKTKECPKLGFIMGSERGADDKNCEKNNDVYKKWRDCYRQFSKRLVDHKKIIRCYFEIFDKPQNESRFDGNSRMSFES
ncbi:uncharacterized protein LOC141856571 [Brevipalpus obovatus]|uniref:uncharacterized protein LOC141856571 n=1 Tax=Brevipalpus obovatus TaxID=246614 RepID=UPI003D9E8A15